MCWALWASAHAEPSIHLDAVLDNDLRTIRGTIATTDLPDAVWVDALTTLPIPDDPRDLARTFPGAANHGTVAFQVHGDAVSFLAILPERWSDVGATRRGTFANGGWYPVALVDGRLPLVAWDVSLRLPSGVVGALGDQAGTGTLHWQATAERASFAAMRGGTLTSLGGADWSTTLLTRHTPRRGLVRAFEQAMPLARVEGRTWSGVAVEGPLRRDLARAGPGIVYTSDRLGRVFPWLKHLHHPPLVAGAVSAWQGSPDPLTRDLAGAASGSLAAARNKRRLAVNWLGLLKWIPAVDTALYNRDMAFQDVLLHRTVPRQDLGDDLATRFAPAVPGTWALAQLRDRGATPEFVGERLALHWTLPETLRALGQPTDLDDTWRLTASRQAWTVAQTTAAPARAPGPVPIRWTLNGQIASINASQGFVSAFAVLTARAQADTRNRFRVWAITNQRTWLEGRFSWTRYLGPLIRPTERAHQLTFGVDSGWLNPNFADAHGARVSLGGTVAWAYDTRETTLFPMRGVRTSASVSAGGLPETGDLYVRTRADGVGIVTASPDVALAAHVGVGWAQTDLPHQRLNFGGEDGVRGFPDTAVQTTSQLITQLEVRTTPLRELSVPLGVLYVRDLHVIGGLDIGLGSSGQDAVAAVGAAFGVGVVVENLGIAPGAAMLTVGVPIWYTGFALSPARLPVTLSLTWGPAF